MHYKKEIRLLAVMEIIGAYDWYELQRKGLGLELSLDDNTLVMFSSDNGATFDVGGVDTKFFNSVAGLRGRKQDLYEGGIREPFIARWPKKIAAGKVSDHVSVQYDLMETLAELTGTTAPANDGVSYLPTLLGKSNQQKKREYI